MEQVTRPKGTGAEYMAELQKKPGYKPAEAEDRDLQALMALPQMARAEFMEKLKAQANKFPLKQRELTGSQTHHARWTLPGGENYREILLHTPMPEGQGFEGVRGHFGGTPNILASVMAKDRTSPEGKKVLHLEEIQSDWHQQGREGGYQPKDFAKQLREAANWHKRLKKESTFGMDKYEYAEHEKALEDAEAEMNRLEHFKYESVPYGPHAKDWHELALKAMIQHAAEKGYDQIAINHGKTLSDRYGLTQNDFDKEDMEPIANKGMVDFYDKKIPAFLNKFGKKHGVQVQPGEVETHPDRYEELSPTAVGYSQWTPEANKIRRLPVYAPVHMFDITPAMREDVLKNGIPRYAEGGDVPPADVNLAKFLELSKEKRRMYHGTRHYTRGVPGGHPITSPEADPNYTEKMRNTGGFESITPGIRGMSFVTPDTEFANEYAGENKKADKMSGAVYPVYVQVKNPFDYENPAHVRAVAKLLKPTDNKWAMHYGKNPKQIYERLASGAWEYIEDPDVQAAAKKLGHDAMYMNEHGIKNLGVFNPNAIKSAIGNRGTYDINEPHMNKATGGVVKEKVTISPNMDVMQYELINRKAK